MTVVRLLQSVVRGFYTWEKNDMVIGMMIPLLFLSNSPEEKKG